MQVTTALPFITRCDRVPWKCRAWAFYRKAHRRNSRALHHITNHSLLFHFSSSSTDSARHLQKVSFSCSRPRSLIDTHESRAPPAGLGRARPNRRRRSFLIGPKARQMRNAARDMPKASNEKCVARVSQLKVKCVRQTGKRCCQFWVNVVKETFSFIYLQNTVSGIFVFSHAYFFFTTKKMAWIILFVFWWHWWIWIVWLWFCSAILKWKLTRKEITVGIFQNCVVYKIMEFSKFYNRCFLSVDWNLVFSSLI